MSCPTVNVADAPPAYQALSSAPQSQEMTATAKKVRAIYASGHMISADGCRGAELSGDESCICCLPKLKVTYNDGRVLTFIFRREYAALTASRDLHAAIIGSS